MYGTVVPTSRPTSDGAESTPSPQHIQSQLPTPLASPPLPNARPNDPPPGAPPPSSSPSLGGAPNGASAPTNTRPPGRPTLSYSAPQLTTHRSRPMSTTQSAAGSTHFPMRTARPSPKKSLKSSRSGSNRGTRIARLSTPTVPLPRESVLHVPSAPANLRAVPSSLVVLLAEARGELNAPPLRVPEAQPGPSSGAGHQSEATAEPRSRPEHLSPEAVRARAAACVDMRGSRRSGGPSTGQAPAPAPAPVPRPTRAAAPSNIMLDNDTERRAAEAEQMGKYFNGRKLKPLARDVTGNARQVLVIAKLHLFIFALINGPYETRVTYLIWARAIFELTWRQQFPDIPFEWPEVDVAEIMVNYLPTLRGRVKEELRSVLEMFIKFHNPVCNDVQLEANRMLYRLAHPLGFYCVAFEPRTGHYQSEIIPRAIAKALFQGPYDVGVLYSHYFIGDRIPENITCFILANLQFCLEEWSTGRFKAGDLGDGHMYQKYVAHKAGIKRLRNKARSRYTRLHKEWLVYCKNYAGAAFVSEVQTQLIVDPSEIREDTPATELDENEEVAA